MRWIGKRIRELREARNLPRIAFGNHAYVWRLESGRLTPRLPKLEHIAKRLGVGIGRLLVTDEKHGHLLMMEDPFVLAVKLFMYDLSEADKMQVLKVLAAAPKKD